MARWRRRERRIARLSLARREGSRGGDTLEEGDESGKECGGGTALSAKEEEAPSPLGADLALVLRHLNGRVEAIEREWLHDEMARLGGGDSKGREDGGGRAGEVCGVVAGGDESG